MARGPLLSNCDPTPASACCLVQGQGSSASDGDLEGAGSMDVEIARQMEREWNGLRTPRSRVRRQAACRVRRCRRGGLPTEACPSPALLHAHALHLLLPLQTQSAATAPAAKPAARPRPPGRGARGRPAAAGAKGKGSRAGAVHRTAARSAARCVAGPRCGTQVAHMPHVPHMPHMPHKPLMPGHT